MSDPIATEDKQRPSYYAIIPAHVRYDDTLPPNAKLLYGEITALCSMEGICWAGNRYFAELYGVKIRAVQNWIEALRVAGHILVDPIDGYKRHIRLPEAERSVRVNKEGHAEKDTRAEKDMPHAKKDMGGMQKKTSRRVLKDTHSITLSTILNNTKSIASSGASEFSASLFQEKSNPVQEVSSFPAWSDLPEVEQQPWREQAQRELVAIHAGSGITPKPKLIEVRAKNLYEVSLKG